MAKKKAKPEQTTEPWLLLFLGLTLPMLAVLYSPLLTNSLGLGSLASLNSNQLNQIFFGSLTTALIVGFLWYYKQALSFSRNWFVAACVYNFAIIFVKFFLTTNQYNITDETTLVSLIYNSLLVSVLYLIVFGLLYLVFEGKIVSRKLHKYLITTNQGKIVFAAALYVAAFLLRAVLFLLPPFSGSTASGYLDTVLSVGNFVLSVALFLAAFGVVEAYGQVRRKMDLKFFFVSGALLIVVIHVVWAIFAYRLFGASI